MDSPVQVSAARKSAIFDAGRPSGLNVPRSVAAACVLLAMVVFAGSLAAAQQDESNSYEEVIQASGVDRVFGTMELRGGFGGVTYSPDGKYLVTGGRTIQFRDPETGKVLDELPGIAMSPVPHLERINSIAYSPDGQLLACGSNHRGLVVWNLAKREKILEKELEILNAGGIRGLAFSPDGERLLVSSGTRPSYVLEVESGEELASFDRGADIYARSPVAYSPDGEFYVFGVVDDLHVHDARTHAELREIDAFDKDEIASMQFRSANELVTCGTDYVTVNNERHEIPAIKIWNITTGELIREIKDENDNTTAHGMRFLPETNPEINPTRAIVKVADEIRIYNLETGEIIRRSAPFFLDWNMTSIHGLAVSPDGARVAIGGGAGLRLFESHNCTRVLAAGTGHDAIVWCVAASPDSSRIATLGGGELHVWNAATAELECSFQCKQDQLMLNACWSPDGRIVYATASRHRLGLAVNEGVLLAFDTRAKAQQFEIEVTSQAKKCAISADGGIIAVAAGAKRIFDGKREQPFIELFEARTGRSLRKIALERNVPVAQLKFSADGKQLLTLDEVDLPGGTTRLRAWDVETGKSAREQEFDNGHNANFAANSTRMAVFSRDELVFSDSESAEVVRRVPLPNEYLAAATISGDGQRIATFSQPFQIVNGQPAPPPPDSGLILRIWDFESGRIIRTFANVKFQTTFPSLSPDGQTLYAGLPEGVAVAWDLSDIK